MATKTRQKWQTELLWREAWTKAQLVSVLCGRDSAAPSSTAKALKWAPELRRMEDQVDGAIRAGELEVLPSMLDPRLLEIIKKADPKLADEIRRASAASQLYGHATHFTPEACIRWATKFPGRFPKFPFTTNDLNARQGHEALDTRERSSLQIIIAALAPLAKVDIAEPVKSAAVIVASARELGLDISERAVANHLNHVGDTIGRRRKPRNST